MIKQYFSNLMILGYLTIVLQRVSFHVFKDVLCAEDCLGYPVLPTSTNVFYLTDLPRIIVCFIFNTFRVFLSSTLFNFVSFVFVRHCFRYVIGANHYRFLLDREMECYWEVQITNPSLTISTVDTFIRMYVSEDGFCFSLWSS